MGPSTGRGCRGGQGQVGQGARQQGRQGRGGSDTQLVHQQQQVDDGRGMVTNQETANQLVESQNKQEIKSEIREFNRTNRAEAQKMICLNAKTSRKHGKDIENETQSHLFADLRCNRYTLQEQQQQNVLGCSAQRVFRAQQHAHVSIR